jgi:hypothetical protein
VKSHIGIPRNEKADALAGEAGEKISWSPVTTMTYLKLRIVVGPACPVAEIPDLASVTACLCVRPGGP